MQPRTLARGRTRLAAAITSVSLATGFSAAPSLAQNSGPVVKTTEGPVQGFTKNGVDIFLGIPYAAPPVGDLRWKPPQPPKRRQDLLDATQEANTCPQVTSLGAFAGPSVTEDCLYLNVFTTGEAHSSRKKPVIVWIHGGGDLVGAAKDYDGSKLATGGPSGTPTVVVTINYRLGVLGFLSESHLNSEGHPWGNYGILDSQAALRWVQHNIASFGGDPKNVTLGGQSSGATDTTANLLSPASAGLFHRAITQSLPISSRFFASPATALAMGDKFAAAAGCSSAECLRALPVEGVLKLQGPQRVGPYFAGPMVDGTIIPIPADEAWTTGAYNHMPILGGSTEDEWTFLMAVSQSLSDGDHASLTPAQYKASNSQTALDEFPLTDYGNNPTLAQDKLGSGRFKCPGYRVLVEQAKTNPYPVYGYEFTYQKAPFYFPPMPNAYDPTGHFQALAYHTADIQFVFPKFHGGPSGVNLDQLTGKPRELQGDEIVLSDQIVAAWTKFAATGNPNGSGNAPWPKFTADSPVLFRQDIPNGLMTGDEFRKTYKCDFWEK